MYSEGQKHIARILPDQSQRIIPGFRLNSHIDNALNSGFFGPGNGFGPVVGIGFQIQVSVGINQHFRSLSGLSRYSFSWAIYSATASGTRYLTGAPLAIRARSSCEAISI